MSQDRLLSETDQVLCRHTALEPTESEGRDALGYLYVRLWECQNCGQVLEEINRVRKP